MTTVTTAFEGETVLLPLSKLLPTKTMPKQPSLTAATIQPIRTRCA